MPRAAAPGQVIHCDGHSARSRSGAGDPPAPEATAAAMSRMAFVWGFRRGDARPAGAAGQAAFWRLA